MSSSGSFMCLIASLTNSGVNKYWLGSAERRAAWGRNLWMGKLANVIHRLHEGSSLQPVGFLNRSPKVDCGKDREMKPDGWNPGCSTGSSWDTYKVEEELLLNLNELWPESLAETSLVFNFAVSPAPRPAKAPSAVFTFFNTWLTYEKEWWCYSLNYQDILLILLVLEKKNPAKVRVSFSVNTEHVSNFTPSWTPNKNKVRH